MSKSLVLDDSTWNQIYNQLAREHPSSVLLLRSKMKQVLGFTVRRHKEWKVDLRNDYREPVTKIHLDFYDEKKRTLFLIKYSDSLNRKTVG